MSVEVEFPEGISPEEMMEGLEILAEDDAFVKFGGGEYIATMNLAALNAQYTGLEAEEMERRQTEQFQTDLANIKGAIGASGIIADTGTSELFLEEMTKSFQKEMDWSRLATKSRQDIALKGGQMAASQMQEQDRRADMSTALTVAGFLI